MKNLYSVTFAVKYTHVGDYMPETVKVVANGNGQQAINKGRKHVLGYSFAMGGKICKAKLAKLERMEQISSIDVE